MQNSLHSGQTQNCPVVVQIYMADLSFQIAATWHALACILLMCMQAQH